MFQFFKFLKRESLPNADFIHLKNGMITQCHLEDCLEYVSRFQWRKEKWTPSHVLIHRDRKRESSYTGQNFNPDEIELVKEGSTHDHCEICFLALYETNDIEHGKGYTNDESAWICIDCYERFCGNL